MTEDLRSNIKIVSNIYPVSRSQIVEDPEFRKQVRGRKALKRMVRFLIGFDVDDEYCEQCLKSCGIENWQMEMFDKDKPCSLRIAMSDYPWGAVLDNGVVKVVCRCKKKFCREFSKCRKDLHSL